MTEPTFFTGSGVSVTSSRFTVARLSSVGQAVGRFRRMPRLDFPHVAMGLLLSFTVGVSARVGGQGVQAVRGVAEQTTVATTTITKDSVLIAVSTRRAVYQSMLTATTTARNSAAFSVLSGAEQAAAEVIRSRDDPQRFSSAVSALNRAERRVETLQQGDRSRYDALATVSGGRFEALNIPVPAVHTLVPDVVFVLGFDVTRLPSDADKKWVTAVGVTTNLLGAAIGTAFDALGSDGLKEYFTNNISAGTAIPASGPHKLTAQLGLGLGGLSIGRFTIWPAINIEQRDTADERVPRKIVALKSSQSNWSSPSFGVAVPLARSEEIVRRIQAGYPVPILTAGYVLPYYFPGDNFTALGALFTSKRSEYERSGGGKIAVGISMPLLKVKPPKPASGSRDQ